MDIFVLSLFFKNATGKKDAVLLRNPLVDRSRSTAGGRSSRTGGVAGRTSLLEIQAASQEAAGLESIIMIGEALSISSCCRRLSLYDASKNKSNDPHFVSYGCCWSNLCWRYNLCMTRDSERDRTPQAVTGKLKQARRPTRRSQAEQRKLILCLMILLGEHDLG